MHHRRVRRVLLVGTLRSRRLLHRDAGRVPAARTRLRYDQSPGGGDVREHTKHGLVTLIQGVGLILMMLTALFVVMAAVYLPLANHAGHVSCLRMSENTTLPTRYVRSGITGGECFIYDNH